MENRLSCGAERFTKMQQQIPHRISQISIDTKVDSVASVPPQTKKGEAGSPFLSASPVARLAKRLRGIFAQK